MISFSMHVAYSVFGCTGVICSSLISFCPSGVAPGGAVYGISTSMRTCDWLSCCAGFLPASPDGSAAAKQHNTVEMQKEAQPRARQRVSGRTKTFRRFPEYASR